MIIYVVVVILLMFGVIFLSVHGRCEPGFQAGVVSGTYTKVMIYATYSR